MKFKRILSAVLAAAVTVTTLLPGTAFAQTEKNASAETEWEASWIWDSASPETLPEEGNVWVNFRKETDLETVPETAVAKIAAESRYWLYVNGELVVFEGGLKRGIDRSSGYYDTVDIAPYLKEGKNTFAVAVWYYGQTSQSFSGWCAELAGFMFEAQIGTLKVVSDESWKAKKDSAYLDSADIESSQPNYRFLESNIYYDAQLSLGEWYAEGYDDSEWESAAVRGSYGDAPWNKLYERPIPLLKYGELTDYTNSSEYVGMTTEEETTIALRVPYNMQMTPYLHISTENAGLVIDIKTDTYVVDNSNSVKSAYVTKAGEQEFEALGWFSGEVVYYTVPAGVTVLGLKYRESGYDTEFAGSFTSDDEFLDSLWEKSLRTLYITMRDNYMDCPDRERAQWWGDVTSEMMMTFYSLDTRAYDLYEKGLYTKLGYIKDDILYTVVPNTNYYGELPMQELAGIVGVWDYYMYTGREYIIEDFYDAAKNYMALWTFKDNGLINHKDGNTVTWGNWMDWGSNQDIIAIENAWYYMATDALINMAELLGKTEDIEKYESVKEGIAYGYQSLWTENGYKSSSLGSSTDPDDRANALAVLAGLATEDQYETILKVLTSTYNSSPYMEKYVYDAMVKMDALEQAQTRMKERYAPMITGEDANSTLWEYFSNTSGTKNHAWSGGPLITMSKDMAGIEPITAGYETYQIKPVLGSLNSINVTVPAIIGDIKADIAKNSDGTYKMDVTAPEGGTATVAVPRIDGKNTTVTVNGTQVFKNGKAADSVNGVTYAENDSEYIYFTVQAGQYSFATSETSDTAESYAVSLNAGSGGTLTVNGGSVTLPYTSTVDAGTVIEITAKADEGYEFDGFLGSVGSTSDTIKVTVNSNTDIYASFSKKDVVTYSKVTVAVPDNDLELYVMGQKISEDKTLLLKTGSTFDIEAKDGEQTAFAYWTGDFYSAAANTSVTVTGDMAITVMGVSKSETNLALGKTVTASNVWGTTTAIWNINFLTDGDPGTGYTSAQLSKNTNVYVTVDLGEAKYFNTVTLYPRSDETRADGLPYNFPNKFDIQVSTDGTDYSTVKSFTDQEDCSTDPQVYDLGETVNARYVRINVTELGVKSESNPRIQIMELEASLNVETDSGVKYNVSLNADSTSTGTGYVLVNGKKYTLPADIEASYGETLVIEAIADDGSSVKKIDGTYESDSPLIYVYADRDITLDITYDYELVKDETDSQTPENYALGAAVTSNYGPQKIGPFTATGLTDGTADNKFTSTQQSKTTNVWVTVDLGAVKEFDTVVLYPRADEVREGNLPYNYPNKFDIQVSNDGTNFSTVKSYTDQENVAIEAQTYGLGYTVSARYVRINATELGIKSETNPRLQLDEMEVYKLGSETNLALGKTVTATKAYTTTNAAWVASNLTDGQQISTAAKPGFTTSVYSLSTYVNGDISSVPQEIVIDLGADTDFNQVVLWARSDTDAGTNGSGLCPNFPEDFTVSIMADGESEYTVVKSVTGMTDIKHTESRVAIDLDYIETARYVKITTTNVGTPSYDEQTGESGSARVQLSEIEVFLKPVSEYKAPAITFSADSIDVTAGGTVPVSTVFTAGNIKTDIVYTVEDENGLPSDLAVLYIDGDTIDVAGSGTDCGTAYLTAHFVNGVEEPVKLAINVKAADPTGVAGPNAAYSFDIATGVLTIEGTGEVWKGVDAEYKDQVKEIVIGEGITTLTDCLFCDYYTSLEKITLPSTLTTIGNWAFFGTALTEIKLPEALTSVGDYAFYGVALEDVTYAGTRAKWDDITIGTNNEALNIVVCDGEISEAITETAQWTFDGNDTLYIAGTGYYTADKNMIPDDIAESIKHIVIDDTFAGFGAYSFTNLTNLETVTGGENMRYLGIWAFSGLEKLTTVEFLGADQFGVLCYGAFSGCSSLDNVTLSDSLKVIGGAAFKNCTSLTSIVIPENITVVAHRMFEGCTALETVEIKGAAELENDVFYGCTSLKSVTLPEGLTTVGAWCFAGARIETLTLPSTLTAVGDYAFYWTTLGTVNYTGDISNVTVGTQNTWLTDKI